MRSYLALLREHLVVRVVQEIVLQERVGKRAGDRHIGGIPSHRHQYPANARMIMPRIHRPPPVGQVNFEPGAEIHGSKGWRYTDIPQVPGHVARRYIEGAAEGHRQVLKVPAYSHPLGKHIQRGLGGAGMLIAKSYLGINPIADGPNPVPAWSHITKQLHCYVGEAIDLAVAAVEQVDEGFVG